MKDSRTFISRFSFSLMTGDITYVPSMDEEADERQVRLVQDGEEKKEVEDKNFDSFFQSGLWKGLENPPHYNDTNNNNDDIEQIEKNGVTEILELLSEKEISELPDLNMPLRHFRQEKGNVKSAVQKLRDALVWRKEFGVDIIKTCFDFDMESENESENESDENNDKKLFELEQKRKEMRSIIMKENESGKIYCRGFHKENGRPTLYFRPGLENTKNELHNMYHLVYHLERAIAINQRKNNLRKVIIIIDFEGYKLSNAPSMASTKMTLSILQHHYPECLFKSYICNPPLLFRTAWKCIKVFIDPVTKEKLQFCYGKEGLEILDRDFGLEHVAKEIGGTNENMREYDSQEYLTQTPYVYAFDEPRP